MDLNIESMKNDLRQAVGLAKSGRTDEAIRTLAYAAQENPEQPEPHIEAARIWHRKESDLDKAFAAYATAARIDPQSAEAYYGAGIVLSERQQPGDEAAAIQWLDYSIRLDRHRALSFRKRGQLLARAGRLNEAVEDFERACELDPGDQKSQNDLQRAKSRLRELQSRYDRSEH